MILQGDCLARLAEIPDESVHCCVTSPRKVYIITSPTCSSMCIDAYFAGLIDGEANVRIKRSDYRTRNPKYRDCKKPQFYPVIAIKMVTPEPLLMLKDRFGGTFYTEKRVQNSPKSFRSNKILHVWQVSNRQAIAVANAILPFSIVKKEHLLNLLALNDLKLNRGGKRESDGNFCGQPYTHELVCEMEKLAIRSKELNS